jgi:hypothetical protein
MSQEALRGGRDAAPADDEGIALVQRYAPDLPRELLHAVLLALGVDNVTLSAAAGVNKSWRAAALHPRFWAHLPLDVSFDVPQQNQRCRNLSDEDLAVLVRRACGSVVDDGHKLLTLSVRNAPRLTLRGVLAALGGPRDDAGTPLLLGALDELSVAGVDITEDDANDSEALILELQSYMRPDGIGRLDVERITQCTVGDCCSLLGFEPAGCDNCGTELCATCVAYRIVEPCDHICSSCYIPGETGLFNCDICERNGKTSGGYCDSCYKWCAVCEEQVCVSCAEATLYVGCNGPGCDVSFCKQCTLMERVEMGSFCYKYFCRDCADCKLPPAEHGDESDAFAQLRWRPQQDELMPWQTRGHACDGYARAHQSIQAFGRKFDRLM